MEICQKLVNKNVSKKLSAEIQFHKIDTWMTRTRCCRCCCWAPAEASDAVLGELVDSTRG
jgi:hypothetical protein